MLEYVNILPGRVRFKSQKIYYNTKLAKNIEKYINSLYGIKSSKVNSRTGSILVVYHVDKTNLPLLRENIENALLFKKLPNSGNTSALDQYHNSRIKMQQAKRKLILWGFLYLLLKMKSLMAGKFPVSRNLNVLKVASAVTIIGGYPLLKKLFRKSVRFLPFDPDRLLEFTALSFTIVRESSKGILVLILKALDDYIKYSSEAGNHKLLLDSYQKSSRMAWIKSSNGEEVLVPADSLEIGSRYYIYPGEIVPAGGLIEEGSAIVNTLYYAGQPLLSQVKKGCQIEEGITIVSGNLKVKVTQLSHSEEKPDLSPEKLSIYTSVKAYQKRTTYIAAGAAALSYLYTGNILNAFSVMLVLSPKAASVALNSGISNYLYLLSKSNIYVKHPYTLEYTRNADKIVFDKTGTLTYGVMDIASVIILDNSYSQEDIRHIYNEWKNEVRDRTADNRQIFVGSQADMVKNKVDITSIPWDQKGNPDAAAYPIYIAVRKKPVGIILLSDTLREDSKDLISLLKMNGIQDISLLTGDEAPVAREVAARLGIRTVYSEKSRLEKAEIIETEKNNGFVMMVGDGINDVMAMRAAHVSVSFVNNACDIVKLHSDCIIYDENLLKLSDYILLTGKSYDAIRHTILLSNLYNIILGAIAFGGGLNIFAAKSLNTLNSLLVLLLNKRILLLRPSNPLYISRQLEHNQQYTLTVNHSEVL